MLFIWSIAREPLYGGVSIGGSGGWCPLLVRPCFDVAVAIVSHAMLISTWGGVLGPRFLYVWCQRWVWVSLCLGDRRHVVSSFGMGFCF